MRIDRLSIRNFKGFESRDFQFHPQFNLMVGTNGTGKTSALDALSVAIGSWFLGVRGADSRPIRAAEVLLGGFEHEEIDDDGRRHISIQWERVFPCEVKVHGRVEGHDIAWSRSLNAPNGRTTYGDAGAIKGLATEADQAIRDGSDMPLPLISYYGTGRLWQEPRESFQVTDPMKVADREEQSRLAGYSNSVDPRLSVTQLTRWIARQSWVTFQQQNREPLAFRAVREAILGCVENAQHLWFDAKLGEVVVEFSDSGARPFSNLSDGQRCMLAMVGDIAQKAAKLNPQLGGKTLEQTQGIVLIDELDLHLHPRWQRHVIEDLRRTFPGIQFICTTHSPFLIQSLRSGEELIMLDGQPTAEVANMSINEIAQGIQWIANPDVSQRYEDMKGVARTYLELLEQGTATAPERLDAFKARLAESIAPYADNPAFQAFLELKRAARLGG